MALKAKVLKSSFFNRPSIEVAEDLLGKYLVRKYNNKLYTLHLTELEVYHGFEDKASHAHKGVTKRNEVMFGPAGYFYVYLCYGMYWLLNVVTEKKGYPAAILIRGAGNINGPGRLTRFLHVDKKFHLKKAIKSNNLWFEDRGDIIPTVTIKRTARIGVSYAGPKWSKELYRFVLEENKNIKLTVKDDK